MTKSEMNYLDWAMLVPLSLVFNQYFDTFFQEIYVLWFCSVRNLKSHN